MTSFQLPKVIGICGQKRSGKDTVAHILHDEFGYKNVKIADDLKVVMKVLFDFSDDQLETNLKESVDHRWDISPRQAMQFFGTEVMQYEINKLMPHIGRKFWIQNMINKHILSPSSPSHIVISDLRFFHEYEELKKYNVFVIQVDRLENKGVVDTHPSEVEYRNIPYDMFVSNDGNIDDLRRQVLDKFMSKINN